MPASNRARLDDWFAAVDQLLTDRHPIAIPPSTEPAPGVATRFTLTPGNLDRDIRVILNQLIRGSGRWVAVLKIPNSDRYVQFMADHGWLVAECSSNAYLDIPDRLTEADEAQLVSLGWSRPKSPGKHNWKYRTTEPDVDELAAMTSETFRRVLGCGRDGLVTVKMWKSSRSRTDAA